MNTTDKAANKNQFQQSLSRRIRQSVEQNPKYQFLRDLSKSAARTKRA